MTDPISSNLSQAPADVTRAAYAYPGPAYAGHNTRPRGSLFVPGLIGFILLGLTGLLVAAFLFVSLGAGAVAIAGFMALIPLTIVLFGVRWVDRWEPEPRGLLLFAFLWGAASSVFLALVIGFVFEIALSATGASAGDSSFIGAVIQAPIVEESAKGLGVLLIFLVARKHFDGPVDGIVYAATVAGGFAFTENILYFGSEVTSADGSVIGIFVMRGLMSPFAHVMFTLCTGVAIGIGARRRGVLGGILGFFIGLIPAMLLHALWNGATYIVTGYEFFLYYAVVQMPLFAGAVVLVVLLRRHESRLTRERLSEYAAAGWFNPDEIPALATPKGRRQAISWARQHGLATVMKGYIVDATKLAFTRQRLIIGHDVVGGQVDEAAILASIVARRAALQPQVVAASAPR